MSPLGNAERQRRFRELTLKERETKAAGLDLLVAAIEAKQPVSIPLTDGKQLQMTLGQDGQCRVQVEANPEKQLAIANARLRKLYGEP